MRKASTIANALLFTLITIHLQEINFSIKRRRIKKLFYVLSKEDGRRLLSQPTERTN